MIDTETVADRLGRLAQHFEDNYQESSKGNGWGQFLDVPRSHPQVGLYGTSAGVIVLALAKRTGPILTNALSTLRTWWTGAERSTYSLPRICQNLRLSMLLLSLRLAGTDDLAREVREQLALRLLPSDLWGEYWVSESIHDQTPRPFTSSVALLSMLLFASLPELNGYNQAPRTAAAIQKKLLAQNDLPELEVAVAAAAILSSTDIRLRNRAKRRIIALALSLGPDISRTGHHFFDYEHRSADSARQYGRDYFIAPITIILALAGLQREAPSRLRTYSDHVLEAVMNNLNDNDGVYRPSGERISTLDQAWVALLLRATESSTTPPSLRGRLAYATLRHRKSWALDRLLPPVALIVVPVLAVAISEGNLLCRMAAVVVTVIVSGLYSQDTLRQLILGK